MNQNERDRTFFNNDHSQKDSSKSMQSDTVSLLSASRGGLLINPNGMILHMKNCKEKNKDEIDSLLNQEFEPYNQQQIFLPVFGDDEMAFYLNPHELPEFVDEVVDTYQKHYKIFIIFLIFQFIIESFFDYVTYWNKKEHILYLSGVYQTMSLSEIEQMFYIFFLGDMIFTLIYYPIGIIGSFKKSFRMLNNFSFLSLIGLAIEIMLTYINKFNIVMFFFRIVGYIYSKFLCHLLLNLLLLPR